MFEVNKKVVGSLCAAALLTAIACGDATQVAVAEYANQSAQKSETAQLKEGATAPDFTLPTDDGRQIKLSDYQGKQTVVLYFYPKDETPGCTKQACAFRDSLADYKKENIEVLGVSVDSVEAHKAFKKNQKLNFTLARRR
jgi:peroxiredoxin Q/BCP